MPISTCMRCGKRMDKGDMKNGYLGDVFCKKCSKSIEGWDENH